MYVYFFPKNIINIIQLRIRSRITDCNKYLFSLKIFLIELEKEKVHFTNAIERLVNKEETTTTPDFWIKNTCLENSNLNLNNLKRLALILANIPASSKFIESNFSICAGICEQTRGNMKADEIVTRSFLKAHLGLLNKMTNFTAKN